VRAEKRSASEPSDDASKLKAVVKTVGVRGLREKLGEKLLIDPVATGVEAA